MQAKGWYRQNMKKIMLVEYEIFINQKTKKDLFLLLLKKNLFW